MPIFGHFAGVDVNGLPLDAATAKSMGWVQLDDVLYDTTIFPVDGHMTGYWAPSGPRPVLQHAWREPTPTQMWDWSDTRYAVVYLLEGAAGPANGDAAAALGWQLVRLEKVAGAWAGEWWAPSGSARTVTAVPESAALHFTAMSGAGRAAAALLSPKLLGWTAPGWEAFFGPTQGAADTVGANSPQNGDQAAALGWTCVHIDDRYASPREVWAAQGATPPFGETVSFPGSRSAAAQAVWARVTATTKYVIWTAPGWESVLPASVTQASVDAAATLAHVPAGPGEAQMYGWHLVAFDLPQNAEGWAGPPGAPAPRSFPLTMETKKYIINDPVLRLYTKWTDPAYTGVFGASRWSPPADPYAAAAQGWLLVHYAAGLEVWAAPDTSMFQQYSATAQTQALIVWPTVKWTKPGWEYQFGGSVPLPASPKEAAAVGGQLVVLDGNAGTETWVDPHATPANAKDVIARHPLVFPLSTDGKAKLTAKTMTVLVTPGWESIFGHSVGAGVPGDVLGHTGGGSGSTGGGPIKTQTKAVAPGSSSMSMYLLGGLALLVLLKRRKP